MGHGGIYCEGCHDSTHAVAPSRETNDGLKFYGLQGSFGTLHKCTVCHQTMPSTAFVHQLVLKNMTINSVGQNSISDSQENVKVTRLSFLEVTPFFLVGSVVAVRAYKRRNVRHEELG